MQVIHVFREVSRVSAGPRLDESCLFGGLIPSYGQELLWLF